MKLAVLLADDPRFGLKAGDVLEVRPYTFAPDEKYTVVRRVSDDFDPCCNVYRSDVRLVRMKEAKP